MRLDIKQSLALQRIHPTSAIGTITQTGLKAPKIFFTAVLQIYCSTITEETKSIHTKHRPDMNSSTREYVYLAEMVMENCS